MTDKLFDDYIREKLKNHTSEVPTDMWDRIVLEKSDNRKGIFWWETLGAAMILVCMAAFFGWFGPLDNLASEKKITANGHVGTALSNPSMNSDESPSAGGALAMTKDKTSDAATINGQMADNHPSIQDTANDVISINEPIKANSSKSHKKVNTKRLRHFSQLNSKLSEDRNNEFNSIENDGKDKQEQDVLSSKQSFLNSILSKGKDDKRQDNEFHFADRLSLLAARQKALWHNSFSSTEMKNFKSSFSSVDCPSEIRGKNGFYVEFFASPDIAFKNMKYKTIAGTNYGNMKDSTETKQLSYTIGMRLTKELGENLVFKTGVQYSKINERFDYRNENERNTTTVVTIRTINNSDGTTTTIRDTSIVEQVGYRVKTTYNHYRSFDIPVLLGYEFAADGWKANINGGAVFNLSSWQEGEFLDTSYSPVSFTKFSSPIFKKKTGISLYGSVSLIKSIGERTDLFAEPYLRYSLTDRTTSASPFTQRFHTAGMLLGIRFKLNAVRAAK